ncbi:MAG: hypothetical protein VYD19_04885 [Myxococcota bacterium]|nr:hypothetical protein [Myxococcota bacterium]
MNPGSAEQATLSQRFGNHRYRVTGEPVTLSCGRLISGYDIRRGGRVTLFYPKFKEQAPPAQQLRKFGPLLTQFAPLRGSAYCTLRDAALSRQEELFLVVDRPRGQPLETLLRAEHGVPFDQALSLTIQLCELIRRAHDIEVYTTTLTPYNLIVCPRPDGSLRLSLVDLALDRRPLSALLPSPPRELTSLPGKDLPYESDRSRYAVYLVTALLHQLIFGVAPARPVSREESPWLALPARGQRLDQRLEACLHTILSRGLAQQPKERFPRLLPLQRALLGLRQLGRLSAPAFDLLAGTQSRLGRRDSPLDLSAPRPGMRRALEARQKIHQILEGNEVGLTLDELLSDAEKGRRGL